MTRYRDPSAAPGRVVFGGEAFHNGVTGDIEIGPETARLFKGAGIVEHAPEPETPAPATDEAPPEPDKPASRRGK